jgi:hypothetical protein
MAWRLGSGQRGGCAAAKIIAEAVLMISLISVGLDPEMSMRDRRWFVPYRLAFRSMGALGGSAAMVGFGRAWRGNLAWWWAALTVDVLASAIQSRSGAEHDTKNSG